MKLKKRFILIAAGGVVTIVTLCADGVKLRGVAVDLLKPKIKKEMKLIIRSVKISHNGQTTSIFAISYPKDE